MSRAAKVTTAVALAVVGTLLVIAVPAVASVHAEFSSWAVFKPTDVPAPTASPDRREDPLAAQMLEEWGDDYVYVGNGTAIPRDSVAGCDDPVWLHLGPMSARLSADLTDHGAREFAAGSVGVDSESRIATYTVAPGDAPYAIGDRFCIANGAALTTLNHTRTIQPGEVLLLRPDTSVPWVPYFGPPDAPAGFQQIDYQLAVEEMSSAALAGDIDTMRSVFESRLAGMFPNTADAALIQRALDAGDLDALRQMFA